VVAIDIRVELYITTTSLVIQVDSS
jgi:hypothetical protein